MSAPKITGLAETNAIVSSVERTGAATVKDQLVELATKFKDAAKVIDPSILGAWFGYDVDEGRLCFVDFDRAEKPVGLESGIEILFRQWKGWRDMSYEGLTQQECDALSEDEMASLSFAIYHTNKLALALKAKWMEVHNSNGGDA